MSQAKPYIPLSINGKETRARIKARHLYLKQYARRARIPEATLSEVLSGSYAAKSDHKDSNYQRVLQKLQRAGFLVQSGELPLSEAV